MKRSVLLASVATALALLGTRAEAASKGLFGPDDRLEYYEVKDWAKTLASSTVALIKAGRLGPKDGAGWRAIRAPFYGPSYQLCDTNDRYYNEPIGAFCSGFLVGADMVMTAGHCVRTVQDCRETRFVFDYDVRKPDQYPTRARASNVYSCRQIVGRQENFYGADWALLRLDRKVQGRAPLKLDLKANVARGTPLFIVGHPSGLPTKLADHAAVLSQTANYINTNLDAFGGNSGSPVFNLSTKRVEGILVRAPTDFVLNDQGTCRLYLSCDGTCPKAQATKLSAVDRWLRNH